MNLQQQIKKLEEKRIQEILDDDSLSKIEKLKLLENENLFTIASYIQHEFRKWEEEAKELEKLKAEQEFANNKDPNKHFYHSKMTDSIFDPSLGIHEKYETVSYADALENLETDENDMVVVITTRNPHIKLLKSKQEVIDVVFDFCVQHKYHSFKINW